MQHNIGNLLENRAFLTPDLMGMHDVATGTQLTFAQLNQRANQAANMYLSLGVKKGDRVALLLMNGLEFVESIFALAKIGAVTVPLNWRLVADELAFIVNDCGVSLLVFDAEFTDVVNSLQTRETPILQWLQVRAPQPCEYAQNYNALVASANQASSTPNAFNDDNLFIMYTSGTTGLPKGAVHSHNTATWATIVTSASIDWRIRDRFLMLLPLFHIGALAPLLTCVRIGVTAIVARTFAPQSAWQLIANEKVTTMLAVPAMLTFMLQVYPSLSIDHSSLRLCHVGAAPVPISLLTSYNQLGIKLLQVYGLTESCGPGCVMDECYANTHAGSTGKAYFYTKVKIVNADGQQAAPNEAGEILINGPHVMKGYWNNPEATDNTIKQGWLYTGDIGTMDEAGFVTIADRKKDMIISGGENIYPAEVESALASHPNILEAAVVGRPHSKWGEVPMAFVVKKNGDISAADVIVFCKTKLASYKCPKNIEFIEALPRNPSGKILKRILREDYLPKLTFNDEVVSEPT